jgi:hypothetical protein
MRMARRVGRVARSTGRYLAELDIEGGDHAGRRMEVDAYAVAYAAKIGDGEGGGYGTRRAGLRTVTFLPIFGTTEN